MVAMFDLEKGMKKQNICQYGFRFKYNACFASTVLPSVINMLLSN